MHDIELKAIRYFFQSDPEAVYCTNAVVKTLGLRGKAAKGLPALLRGMVRSGELIEKRRGYYRAGAGAGTLTGTVKVMRSGAGLVTAENGKAVFVESRDMKNILPGDVVQVNYRMGSRVEPVGVIKSIDQESVRNVVGTVFSASGMWFVSPLNPIYTSDFRLASSGGANVGDRVLVQVKRSDLNKRELTAKLLEVIGPADQPSLDTITIMKQYELPEDFPADVMTEAEEVESYVNDPGTREDLRDLFTLTIDPATARDYDDAVSLQTDEDGNRVLGVHIADVSHYVREGSKLDREAFKRSTSVYLLDRVVPMLPEQLSNGICSLQPHVDRLAFSVFMTFDKGGHIIKRRFSKSIIRSEQRLCYEDAMKLIKGQPVAKSLNLHPEAPEFIKKLIALTRQLKALRDANDALEMASTDVEIEVNADGRMTGIHAASMDESHVLIECCMVAANEAVATELQAHGIRIISRLHEAPDIEKINKMIMELKKMGFRPRNLNEPHELSRFLKETENHPLRYHAHILVLRSLKRAIYSADASGHFGLALHHYTHFTSPIRRYTDLVTHRQLADYLAGRGKRGAMDAQQLVRTAAQATDREMIADEAERALTEIKKYRFLQQQLADGKPVTYDAVVVSVKSFGCFVDVVDLQLSGMIHISSISKKFVNYTAGIDTLNAGDLTIKTGTSVKVYINKVNFPDRRLDFIYVTGSAKDNWTPATRERDKARDNNRDRKAVMDALQRKQYKGKGPGRKTAPRAGGAPAYLGNNTAAPYKGKSSAPRGTGAPRTDSSSPRTGKGKRVGKRAR